MTSFGNGLNVYLGIKFHTDHRNRVKIDALAEMLARYGHSSVCVQRDIERWGAVSLDAPELMRASFELMATCDLVLIDLTEKGVGLGIEAGYAHARGIPVVTIARAGSDLSQTLIGISRDVRSYEKLSDLEPLFATFGQRSVRP